MGSLLCNYSKAVSLEIEAYNQITTDINTLTFTSKSGKMATEDPMITQREEGVSNDNLKVINTNIVSGNLCEEICVKELIEEANEDGKLELNPSKEEQIDNIAFVDNEKDKVDINIDIIAEDALEAQENREGEEFLKEKEATKKETEEVTNKETVNITEKKGSIIDPDIKQQQNELSEKNSELKVDEKTIEKSKILKRSETYEKVEDTALSDLETEKKVKTEISKKTKVIEIPAKAKASFDAGANVEVNVNTNVPDTPKIIQSQQKNNKGANKTTESENFRFTFSNRIRSREPYE